MNNEALSGLKGGQDSGLTEANRKMGTQCSLPVAKYLIPQTCYGLTGRVPLGVVLSPGCTLASPGGNFKEMLMFASTPRDFHLIVQ